MTTASDSNGWTLVLTETQAREIESAARLDVETGAVLLCRAYESATGSRFVLDEIYWVGDDAYLERTPNRLVVGSAGYVPVLAHAESRGLVAGWFHTHPGSLDPLRHSELDRRVDDELGPLFRLRTGADAYLSVIGTSRDGVLGIIGELVSESGETTNLATIVTLGDALRVAPSDGPARDATSDLYSRQVAAFGGPVQSALASLKVAVVGCGGTGSAVGEQLTRLGVKSLVLVDPDRLDLSNVTRVYGSTPVDVGRPKADVLREHLSGIAPDAEIVPVRDTITSRSAAHEVAACDVVFGCTDDNAGRIILSRLAAYARQLVIDMGVLITSAEEGTIDGINGRVTVMRPGQACLLCRGRVDLGRAAAEQLSEAERTRLEGEGYAPALGGIQPAVVAYTTAVAAAAVAELIEHLVGYGPSPRPSEILIRAHDREASTNSATPRSGHFCDPATQPDDSMFLGKAWIE